MATPAGTLWKEARAAVNARAGQIHFSSTAPENPLFGQPRDFLGKNDFTGKTAFYGQGRSGELYPKSQQSCGFMGTAMAGRNFNRPFCELLERQQSLV